MKQLLKLGIQNNVIDKKILLYYEAIDIIKYCKMIYVNHSVFIFSITKLNIMKLIVLLLVLL